MADVINSEFFDGMTGVYLARLNRGGWSSVSDDLMVFSKPLKRLFMLFITALLR
jgi:hypothetical protein